MLTADEVGDITSDVEVARAAATSLELPAGAGALELQAWLAEAAHQGCDAALASATWLADMTEADARSLLDDVDPAVVDRYPGPNLSGEWSDDPTPASLTSDITGLALASSRERVAEVIGDAWGAGRDSVWEEAVQAHALRLLGMVATACDVERNVELVADAWRIRSELAADALRSVDA